MYLLECHVDNALRNLSRSLSFETRRGALRKWTLLPPGPAHSELLQVMALSCGGIPFIRHLNHALMGFSKNVEAPLQVESLLLPHPPRDGYRIKGSPLGVGLRIDHRGTPISLKRNQCRHIPSEFPVKPLAVGNGNGKFLFLAYGPFLKAHCGTDSFDFSNPLHRLTRFQSLFAPLTRLTDPVAFLKKLHYRAIRAARYPAQGVLQKISVLFAELFHLNTGPWMGKACDFSHEWSQMRPWEQRALLPVLDAMRHMLDAYPHSGAPLEEPALLLMDRPDRFCTERIFPEWIRMLDRLFPSVQLILTLSERATGQIPSQVLAKRLSSAPSKEKTGIQPRPVRLRPGMVLLIDVDGRLPNLALMKLSQSLKQQGRRVVLLPKEAYVKGVEAVYASCVFTSVGSLSRVKRLEHYYRSAFTVGGSGIDIRRRLPQEIEGMPPDYGVYPNVGKVAIGFLTRGCPYHCPFCIVPQKEGPVHQVAELEELLQGDRHKLILLDDNILSHPNAPELLEEMVRRNIQVNFSQTLDIRLLDQETSRLIRRIHCSNLKFTRRVVHFSLNDCRHLDLIRRKYDLLGFGPGDNTEFICMYGYNTTLKEDVERFRFLRSLPGAYVFVQEYQPIPGGPARELIHFFDEQADEQIDALIRIKYSQNMKSMERYYRWVNRRYAETFGRLHRGLVDTIFRYNNRHNKGRYLATLAGTRDQRKSLAGESSSLKPLCDR